MTVIVPPVHFGAFIHSGKLIGYADNSALMDVVPKVYILRKVNV